MNQAVVTYASGEMNGRYCDQLERGDIKNFLISAHSIIVQKIQTIVLIEKYHPGGEHFFALKW